MTRDTTNGLGRRTILATMLAALGAPAMARSVVARDMADLTVVDRETGEPLRVWRHQGRAYVAGRPGARYGLRVTNNTGGRILVVMSVDGVNVLTGQTAGYGQQGYVFDPYQSYLVTGWRKSDSEVAAFDFSSLASSYAARTGRPGDVGVIGIAAFREREWENADTLDEVVVSGSRRGAASAAEAAPSAAAPRRESRLGTGHGARERSVVESVAFERATRAPQLVRQISYDTYANLAAQGVIPRRPQPDLRPRPFPASGYVPDPPGQR